MKASALFFLLAVTTAGVSGSTRPASAQDRRPSASQREVARNLMDQGVAQRGQGDLRAALRSFQAADAIMGVSTTGLEVARTLALLNLLAEAREAAMAVAQSKPLVGELAPLGEARARAAAMVVDLDERIPTLQITLKGFMETPRVVIDVTVIASASLGRPVRLNPGAHVVMAQGNGSDARLEVALAERDHKTVEIEAQATRSRPAADVAPAGGALGSPAPGRDLAVTSDRGRGGASPLAVGSFALGAAGLVAGGVTGVLALAKKQSLADQCSNDGCPRVIYDSKSFQDDLASGRTMATISTIGFVVGALGASTGVVALLTRSKAAPEVSTRSSSLRLAVAPDGALHGTF